MVYARKHGSTTFTFQVSGMLWRNSLIMQDRETGTAWSQVTGDAILGQHKGETLRQIPADQTLWSEWYEAHPDTLVLKKDEEVRASHYQEYFDDPEKTGLFRSRWLMETMPGKTLVYGIKSGPHALAVTPASLARGGVVQTTIGDTPVVVMRTAAGGVAAWTSFQDRQLRFVPAVKHAGKFRCRRLRRGAGFRWNAR